MTAGVRLYLTLPKISHCIPESGTIGKGARTDGWTDRRDEPGIISNQRQVFAVCWVAWSVSITVRPGAVCADRLLLNDNWPYFASNCALHIRYFTVISVCVIARCVRLYVSFNHHTAPVTDSVNIHSHYWAQACEDCLDCLIKRKCRFTISVNRFIRLENYYNNNSSNRFKNRKSFSDEGLWLMTKCHFR